VPGRQVSGRGYIKLTDKLAAALRELFQIPYEHAKLMSAEQVLSLVQWNHIHYHADMKDDPDRDAHWNLEPMLIQTHRERTAKIDIPQIAKTKRISKQHEEFKRLMLTPRDERLERKSRWPSRKFPKRVKS
jgi:hypothetical protein